MNVHERVLKTLNHEEADRIPLFNQDIMLGFKKKLLQHWGNDFTKDRRFIIYHRDFNFEKKLGFDCAWGFNGFPLYIPHNYHKSHPVPQLSDPDRFIDIDGRVYKKSVEFDSDNPWYLKNYITTDEMADYFYDTYYSIEWEEDIDFASKINRKFKKFPIDEFVPCCHMLPILEPIWEGIGLSLLMKLIRKKRSTINRYIDLRTKIGVKWAKMIAETDFEIFFLCDDTALKNKTMINPTYHKELIIPAYKKMVKEIRKAGKFAIFHSDGFTEPYFDGLIEAGFHGIESLEPNAGMDLKHLKETYGDKVCLIGNIDVSRLLPYGTTNEVVETVKRCIKDAGEGGGYMLSPCTDLTNSCKVENVLTMISAAKKYGNYT